MKKTFDETEEAPTASGERGSIGFIDPSDEYSIKELHRILRSLPPISVDNLDFSQYNDYVKRFHRFFADNMHKYVYLLRGQELMLKYPHEIITRMIEQRSSVIEKCLNQLQEIKSKSDKETMEKYDKIYSVESFSSKVRALERQEKEARSICERLRKEIEELKKIPPEIIRREWNVEGFHPRQRVKYENDAPFTFTVETREGTEETEIFSKDEHNFDVVYSNGNWLREAGHSLNIIAQAFLSIFNIEGLKHGLNILDNKLVVACCGQVTFKIRPQDVPENKRALEEMIERAKAWEDRAAKAVEEREKYNSCSVKNVEEKITTVLDSARKQKDILLSFERFRVDMTQLIASVCKEYDVIDLYRKSALAIFKEDNRTIDTENFLRLCQVIRKGNVSVITDESNVSFAELDVEKMEKIIKEEFPQKGASPH